MLEANYEMQMVTLTKASAENLIISNPRRLRSAQVTSIYQNLKKGKHFESNFVVNELAKTRIRIIDGQHRIAALKRYFKEFPDERVRVWFATYKSLTPTQEREMFTRWNVGTRQTTDDFINSYKEEIPIYEELTAKLPCSIYPCPKKMKMKDLINAHRATKELPYKGGESITTYDFIRYMQKMTHVDVNQMVENYNILQEIFNPNGNKDFHKMSAFKNVVFRALYYLVANNKGLGGYMRQRMKSALSQKTILDQYRRFYGRRASVDAYLAFRTILNDGPSDKKFK
jgi:hypothetical protein